MLCRCCAAETAGPDAHQTGMRTCGTCGIEQEAGEFYIRKDSNKYRNECKGCRKAREKQTYDRWRATRTSADCIECGAPTVEGLARCQPCREGNLAAQRKRRRSKRAEVFAHYGGRCACCGETEVSFLSIDHVNGDGAAHRQTVPMGSLPAWLIRNGYPEGFQLLCMNCNWGRNRNGGVCPHKLHRDPEQHSRVIHVTVTVEPHSDL